MPVQTGYSVDFVVGIAGQLADLNNFESVSGNLEGALNLPFGVGLKKGTAQDGYLGPTASADVIEGIGIHSHATSNIGFGALTPSNTGIVPNQMFGVLRRGQIYVQAENAVAAHGQVFCRFGVSPNLASLTQPGAFRADVDSYTGAAWAITTPYTVGQRVSNGGNVYECTAPGTSAGSGGPSGTGSSITDSGVTWKYVTTTGASAKVVNGARWLTAATAGAVAKLSYDSLTAVSP